MTRILVDADACPVIQIIERIAQAHAIPVILFCDTNHFLLSDYSEVKVIGAGKDAVDLALINQCCRGDIVVTQDYGVAALALGKGAWAIHQNGRIYTQENIDRMLFERYLNMRARQSKSRPKGPKRRTPEDDERFARVFEILINEIKKRREQQAEEKQ